MPDRLRTVLALLGCLAVALALAVVTPDPATDVRRRWHDAAVGVWASEPSLRVRVGSVQVVRAVDPGYGDVLVSRQALVVTTVDAQVRREVRTLDQVRLETRDGAAYAPRSELASAGLASTQPGFTRRATLVFEVPPDRLDRAMLVVDADGASVDVYADALRVDLGLRGDVAVDPETVTPDPSTVSTT